MKFVVVALFAVIAVSSFRPPACAAEPRQVEEKVLHSFGSSQTDGGIPVARLLDVGGLLYGTTLMGGANPQGGTVFVFDPGTGAEQVLYSFCAAPRCGDGGQPRAGLIEVNGLLYGTTNSGGAADDGAVFSVYPGSGTERVIYSFCSQQSCADGQQPAGELLEENGILYGTTESGGATGNGTVYALDPNSGDEQVLHAFAGGRDGISPRGALIDMNGKLYGTTDAGGANNGGTLFAINPVTGTESVLYSFCSQQYCADGQAPLAGLVATKTSLYGTTYRGGTNGVGTVFAFQRKTRAEQTLYSFCSAQTCADGSGPYVGLTRFENLLYGTTQYGGSNAQGAVFALDAATGAESAIYSFCSQQNCADGADPSASLIHVGGKLYGTTSDGGTSTLCQGGCGVLFSLKP